MRTVTVLGAGGFLGSALSATLAREPVRLRLVGRRPIAPPADAVAEVTTHVLDVGDPAALTPVLEGSDVVLVAVRPSWDWRRADATVLGERVNVAPVRTLVETFAGREETPLCVYVGSTGQAGPPPSHPMDGTETDAPNSDYESQKLDAERILLAAHAAGVVRSVSVRLHMVYGQQAGGGTDPGIVRTMAVRALGGGDLTVWGDGGVERDLLHVDDCVDAFRAVLDDPEPLLGRHWVVGSGEAWPIARLFGTVADAVAAHTGRPRVSVVHVPPPDHAVSADACSVRVDASRFRAVTGWEPRVSIEEGVGRAVAVLAGEFADAGVERRA